MACATQASRALGKPVGRSCSAWLAQIQRAAGLCASLLITRSWASRAWALSSAAIRCPSCTGNSAGQSGVKVFCASMSRETIMVFLAVIGFQAAYYSPQRQPEIISRYTNSVKCSALTPVLGSIPKSSLSPDEAQPANAKPASTIQNHFFMAIILVHSVEKPRL